MNDRATFSLLTFLGLVTVAGIGMAALANRTTWWASITVTLTLAVCVLGVLCVFVFRGGTRAFWFGCTSATVCYMLVTFHPWLSGLGSTLVTTRLLAYTWINVEKTTDTSSGGNMLRGFDPSEVVDYEVVVDAYPQIMLGAIFNRSGESTREIRSFFQIGQALLALVFGLVAGVVTYLLSLTQRSVGSREPRTAQPIVRTHAGDG